MMPYDLSRYADCGVLRCARRYSMRCRLRRDAQRRGRARSRRQRVHRRYTPGDKIWQRPPPPTPVRGTAVWRRRVNAGGAPRQADMPPIAVRGEAAQSVARPSRARFMSPRRCHRRQTAFSACLFRHLREYGSQPRDARLHKHEAGREEMRAFRDACAGGTARMVAGAAQTGQADIRAAPAFTASTACHAPAPRSAAKA